MNAQKLGYLLPLSEVCEVNPRNVTGLDPDTSVTFVPMSAVDERTGSIVTPEIKDYQEVAKGYTPFRNNDVLFAKITPCMENGKCAIARRLENGWGFGSTEFHVLRASDKVLPEWVYYFIRQEEVRNFAASNMTGTAGQQRVPKSVFDRLLIPVPPLPIQKQIAGILEKADATREKRRQANQLTEQFLQSAFLEMFGDGTHKHAKLRDVCRIITDGTHITPKYLNQGVPFVSVKDVRSKKIDFNDVKYISHDEHLFITKRCRPEKGDILYTKVGATFGNAVLVDVDTEFSIFVSLALLKPKFEIIEPTFLRYMMNTDFVKSQARQRIRGIAVPDLHLIEIKDFDIYVPEMAEQRKFLALVEKVESLRAKQRESEKELDNLFNSLMQRAFRGELVG